MGNCTFFSSMHSRFIFLAKVQLKPSKQSSLGSVACCRASIFLLEHIDSRLMEKGLTRLSCLDGLETLRSLRRSSVQWQCMNSFWTGGRSRWDWRRRMRLRGKKSGGRRLRFSLIDFCRCGWLRSVFCLNLNSKGSDSRSTAELAIIRQFYYQAHDEDNRCTGLKLYPFEAYGEFLKLPNI